MGHARTRLAKDESACSPTLRKLVRPPATTEDHGFWRSEHTIPGLPLALTIFLNLG